MANYIEFQFSTDPSELWQDAVDYIKDRVPGWEPSEGSFINIQLEAESNMAAEVRDIGAVMPKAAFRAFGAKIINIPPADEAFATVPSTWTAKDNAGYTIIAGTLVAIPIDGSSNAGFEVVDDVTIPAGSTATAAGEVILQAVLPGSQATDLGGVGVLVDVVDSVAFVDNVALTAATSGGVDAEDDDAYLDRLSDELRLLTPRPILPEDFAVLARNTVGVGRAVALDGYNPADDTYNNERMVTVAVVDIDGNNLTMPIKDAVSASLEAQREINFIVNVIDPTHTSIDVTFNAVAYTGWDAPEVQGRAVAAIEQYLDPSTWGTISGTGEAPQWSNVNKVRYLELTTVLNNVPGLDYVTGLTFAATGDPLATADVDLPGPIPLPFAGTTNGTVTSA